MAIAAQPPWRPFRLLVAASWRFGHLDEALAIAQCRARALNFISVRELAKKLRPVIGE
jgi:hypothetical protein